MGSNAPACPPAKETGGDGNDLAGEAATAPAGTAVSGSGRDSAVPPEPRIIVISDDLAEARSLAWGLARAGTAATVVRAADVVGWDEVRVQGVDVFVVGVAALDDARIALLERIRERSPMTEIVVVSPDPLVENTVQAVRAGVHSVLRAPASADQLGLEVGKALARRRWAKQRLGVLAKAGKLGR